MPKDRKKLMSDGELSEMFLNIGRAKEAVAEGIIAEQKEEEKEKRRQLKEKLKFFVGAGENFDEDFDYDEEFRALEQEIEWVRSGKIHKYDSGVVLTEEGSERPDALEEAINQIETEESLKRPEASVSYNSENSNNDEQSKPELKQEEPVAEESASEDSSRKPAVQEELELDGAATELNVFRAYFVTSYDSKTGVGRFAYDIYKGDTLLESKMEDAAGDKAETVIFIGALKMLQCIQFTKCTSAILVMSESTEELLKKNAIYGLTGDFGKAAVEYIKKVRELSTECYLRVLSGIHTEEMSIVTRRIQTNQ